VRLTFDTPSTLAVGTPVRAEIDAEEHTNVVLVPLAALVHEGEETAVFVAAGNKAQRRPVTVGITDDEHAEISSGLKAGEPVIVKGQAGLPDGASITTEKPSEKKESDEKSEKPDKVDKADDEKPAGPGKK